MSIAGLRVLIVDRAGAQSIWSIMDVLRAALEAKGHTVHTCRWNDGSAAQEDRFSTGPRDHVINVGAKRHAWDIVTQHHRFARGFDPLLKQLNPDVLHTNFAIPGAWATWHARYRGVPRVIMTRHELASSMAPHLRLIAKISARQAHHAVHVSQVVAASYGFPAAPVYRGGKPDRALVIRNGIDLAHIARIRPGFSFPDERTILVCGRLVPLKGVGRALTAFRLAARQDARLRLDFIGDGSERAALQRQTARLGLTGRVRFHGWRSREETLAKMRTASLVVIPSLQEGFGLVLAEAMALRRPVIASDIPVFREVAALGRGVVLLDTSDRERLARAMLSPPDPSETVSAAIDQVTMAEAYVALYDAIAPQPMATDLAEL